ncbi:MAG: bifunctional glutamate N-acetyltransferase/amino-acid acetyltransferase ArgJ [Caldilineaceae bacterium]|nr:bifunctional glutamate N-acetyltransferase/amino-acid acetyltransferase ArgJ [Caldilineaceae bacterium]MDE0068705.1 bifunctional glutamate N-acetyltransferase/amino-acid acetyltransferase ArgJ [Caldilineaceae bacterium]
MSENEHAFSGPSTAPIPVTGFDAAGIHCGIKPTGAPDLAMIASPTACRAAAVFTQNAFPAAPVLYDRELLRTNPDGTHAVVINSGNANACTSAEGNANARRMAEAAEKSLGSTDNTAFVMSTGVIGVQLPIGVVEAGIPQVAAELRPDGWEDAAAGIMTTDVFPKWASSQAEIGGSTVTITGIGKGAGMIHPNMATMLATLATDANIAQPLLQKALASAVSGSFNRISVDGDTSTNDTVLVLANGAAGNAEIVEEGADYEAFLQALTEASAELAKLIVRNGEGVTKFVTIQVEGAVSDDEAHQVANSIAKSPLVKTAFFGHDANWGRILCAVGYSGATVDPTKAHLFIAAGQPQDNNAELQLVDAGTPTDYAEEDASAIFAESEISARVSLGLGEGAATVWTCDLSYEYVSINAEYRT